MREIVCINEPPPSACGQVKEDAIYLRGTGGGGWGGGEGTAYKFTAVYPAPGDATGVVTGTKYTTPRVVHAEAVLANMPEADWLASSSEVHYVERLWAQRAEHVYGMPLRRRLDHGILDGVTTAEEAQAVLLGMKPADCSWPQAGPAISRLSKLTVEKENLHGLVQDAYDAWRQGKVWRVVACLHLLLAKKNLPRPVRTQALAALECIAPEDRFWLEMEAAA
jgi:hypothetical protein